VHWWSNLPHPLPKTPRSCSVPPCSSALLREDPGRPHARLDGRCHSTRDQAPRHHAGARCVTRGSDFLIHPECGCSTASWSITSLGDIASGGLHMLSHPGSSATATLGSAARRCRRPPRIVPTETGMRHPLLPGGARPLSSSPPTSRVRAAHNEHAAQLRGCAARRRARGQVPPQSPIRARVPIERMVGDQLISSAAAAPSACAIPGGVGTAGRSPKSSPRARPLP